MPELNSKGTNAKIKANILSDNEMRKIGFTDYLEGNWYYHKTWDDISFNVTIPKNGSDIEIITLDENFCQPYDYQNMLERNPRFKPAFIIREKVEEQMKYLEECGVLTGHVRGEYI